MLKRNLPVTVAVALGLLLAAIALVAVLGKRGERLAGTNSLVYISGRALPLGPGERRCADEYVPPGAETLALYAGTLGRRGPPVEVTVGDGGRVVTSGRAAGGYRGDVILRIPLRARTRELERARVCLHNRGSRRVQFAGNRTAVQSPTIVGAEEIRLDWLLPGQRTWASLAPKVADRFAATKPTFMGAWTLWALIGVVAALWAAALAVVWRETRR